MRSRRRERMIGVLWVLATLGAIAIVALLVWGAA